MAKLGTLVKPRTALADIPGDIVATVVPVERSANAKRDPFAWAIDGYNTVKVMVYLPEGTTLPKGGIELTAEDFDLDGGTDKQRQGRAVAVHSEPVEGGSMLVTIEGPKDFDLESLRISHK